MSARFIIADVTSHRRGFGVQPIIDAAARRAQTNHGDGKVLWLVPSHLTGAFNAAHGLGSNSEIRNCDIIGPPLWSLIQREIESVFSTAASPEITIVTWDQLTYGEARNHGRGVIAAKWFDWLAESRIVPFARPHVAQPLSAGRFGSGVPTADQLRPILLDYLKSAGATSESRAVFRSQLRPALNRAIPEIQATSSHPLFASSFKAALDSAIIDKVIDQECSAPGKERVWVAESPAVPAAAEVNSKPLQVAPVAPSTAPTYGRTAEFRKRLTILGIFCEKRDRDVLLEAIGRVLKGRPSLVARLRRELPKVAQQVALERNVCAKTDFTRIANFFLKLLIVSGALLREGGSAIERNASAESAAATGLVENASDVLDSYLLEQILKKSDVKDGEHWQLAHVLYREFDPSSPIDDKLDRIAVLIGGLSNRVDLSDNGTYEYTGGTPASVRRIRAQG
jgi:hypothetical protein